MCYTAFFSANLAMTVIISFGDYIFTIYDMVIIRHCFSIVVSIFVIRLTIFSNLQCPTCLCGLHVICVESEWTLQNNCFEQDLNQVFSGGTNRGCWVHALPLCHCSLLYLA
jgi:hypothetical protein